MIRPTYYYTSLQTHFAFVLAAVAAAIMTPPTGFLAGRFGVKRLFRDRNFAAGMVFVFLVGIVFFAPLAPSSC